MEHRPNTGEVNLAYQPTDSEEANEKEWPTFYEKLAHFNSQHPPMSTNQTQLSSESKDASPSTVSGHKSMDASGNISDVSSMSKGSSASNPPTPDRQKQFIMRNLKNWGMQTFLGSV